MVLLVIIKGCFKIVYFLVNYVWMNERLFLYCINKGIYVL